jgi:hypothetical protein
LLAIDATAAAHVLGKLADAGVQASVIGRVELPDPGGTRVRLNMV